MPSNPQAAKMRKRGRGRSNAPDIAAQQTVASFSGQQSRAPVAGGPPGAVQGGAVAHKPGTPQSNIITKLQNFFGLVPALDPNKQG